LPLHTLKEILTDALKKRYAFGAFNITNLIEMKCYIEAAVEENAPLIIQTTERVAKFCADEGYTGIMLDASEEPFLSNLRKTREVSDYCHKLGIPVEGELGTISGKEEHGVEGGPEGYLCNPEKALTFVEETGIDFFAPAIGTMHGLYSAKKPSINLNLLSKINTLINWETQKIPLVIHGGTGTPTKVILEMLKRGAAKFNVSTAIKKVLIDTTFLYISEHRDEYLPENYDAVVYNRIKDEVKLWMTKLGEKK